MSQVAFCVFKIIQTSSTGNLYSIKSKGVLRDKTVEGFLLC